MHGQIKVSEHFIEGTGKNLLQKAKNTERNILNPLGSMTGNTKEKSEQGKQNKLHRGVKVGVPALHSLKTWKGKIIKMSDDGDKGRCIVKLNKENEYGVKLVSVLKSDISQ